MVDIGIGFEIGAGQTKQGYCRTRPALLHVNERARELNEAFVKVSVRAMTVRQPQILQYVVRFVELLAIEAIEVTQVVCSQRSTPELLDAPGDVLTLLAHKFIVMTGDQCEK